MKCMNPGCENPAKREKYGVYLCASCLDKSKMILDKKQEERNELKKLNKRSKACFEGFQNV